MNELQFKLKKDSEGKISKIFTKGKRKIEDIQDPKIEEEKR